ncbi:MAG: amidohydrolase [Firmicutes bacterium]|nr:amidohydrolase [Bacillota bacterium]
MFNITQEVKKIESEIISWRRQLHMIPELHTELPKTTAFIKARLDEMGLTYKTYTNNGITTVIEGSENGPVIAFRADMDALPVKEETDLPFASTNENMHACGHDAHAAMLLGAAKVLSENRDQFKGKVVMIWQPAEETSGGAKDMIEEGCLANPEVDRFISMHIGSLFKEVTSGKFGVKRGPMCAACAAFYVKIKGKGGHGARPHECIDPLLISCEIVQSLQKLVSREISPAHSAVVTVGTLHAGTIVNIIPDEATFGGTVRCYSPENVELLEKRIKEIVSGTAAANRAVAEIEYIRYYPATINDFTVTDYLAECAAKIIGKENVFFLEEPLAGTEDVAFYINEVPGTYGILGSALPHTDGQIYPLHNSKMVLDESVFWIGSAIFVQAAVDFCR